MIKALSILGAGIASCATAQAGYFVEQTGTINNFGSEVNFSFALPNLSRNYIATLQFGSLHNIVLEGQILNVVQYHYNSSPDYGYDEYYTTGMDVYGPQTRFVFGAGGLIDDSYYEFRASTIYVGFTGHRTGEDVPYTETYYRFTLAEVPEPAAWGMLIGGFGIAGATTRARAKLKPNRVAHG